MTKRVVRPDIQFLRMVAVLMVTFFHFWPGKMPGGFAGVDVFFVISGFLISGSLIKQLDSPKGLNVWKFWEGRVRRLIPAALLVAVVSYLALFVLVNPILRKSSIAHFVPSFLYFENIQLQLDSADYFADSNPSIFQHYWSLSVEEQFYIVWPLILIGVAVIRKLSTNLKRDLGIAIAVISAISFGYGLYLTNLNPAVSYFDSFARAWEFGIGALIAAFATSKVSRTKNFATIFGVALIGISANVLNETQEFPGFFALLPALGAALAIWGIPGLWANRFMEWKPFQFIGDISYSLYLWHWPVVTLITYSIGQRPSNLVLVSSLLVTVGLAWATKRFVEDPIRFSPAIKNLGSIKTFGTLAVSMVAIAALAFAGTSWNNGIIRDREIQLQKTIEQFSDKCLGAESMQNLGRACEPVPADLRIPADYQLVSQILPEIQDPKCRANTTEQILRVCEFGNNQAEVKLALVGDSHAAPWFSTLKSIALQNNWHLTTYYKSSCTLALGKRTDKTPGKASSCEWWSNQVMSRLLKSETQIVILGYAQQTLNIAPQPGETNVDSSARALSTVMQRLVSSGKKVIAVRDTPVPGAKLAKCLLKNQKNPSVCDLQRKDLLQPVDAMQVAADQNPSVVFADFSDYFCDDKICPALVGGIYAYRDDDHISSTFADTLRTVWVKLLDQALVR